MSESFFEISASSEVTAKPHRNPNHIAHDRELSAWSMESLTNWMPREPNFSIYFLWANLKGTPL